VFLKQNILAAIGHTVNDPEFITACLCFVALAGLVLTKIERETLRGRVSGEKPERTRRQLLAELKACGLGTPERAFTRNAERLAP
jgi:hypothetical protein